MLLITSSGGNGWVFPKGGWELDETAEAAALRETIEEGGVRGDLDPAVLGAYPYSNRKTSPTRKGCIAHMYAMSVREELSVWPESHSRERCWVRFRHSYHSWTLHLVSSIRHSSDISQRKLNVCIAVSCTCLFFLATVQFGLLCEALHQPVASSIGDIFRLRISLSHIHLRCIAVVCPKPCLDACLVHTTMACWLRFQAVIHPYSCSIPLKRPVVNAVIHG